ncbi:MAG: hypothetical protein ACI31V_03115 [Bacilli bacterium]
MEEKKEKKTIKCSYALLVIILFATVAFLTDYIIIDRKTRKCDCPKCEATSNEVISDNTDNTQVTENDEKNVDPLEKNMENYDYFKNISCIEKKDMYCLFENKDNLKVEIEADSKLNYSIIINGNKFFPNVDYSTYLESIQILNDGYVFVNYGEQGIGPRDKAFILDSNGNVITQTSNLDYVLSDYDRNNIEFSDNNLKLSNRSYGDGGIVLACNNKKENINTWPEYNEIVYVAYTFEYVGNGKLKETSMYKKTFSELLKEQSGYSTCEELWNR